MPVVLAVEEAPLAIVAPFVQDVGVSTNTNGLGFTHVGGSIIVQWFGVDPRCISTPVTGSVVSRFGLSRSCGLMP